MVRSTTGLLARLERGDRIPWKLDGSGEPQWLTVTEVTDETTYEVRYPDGTVETLADWSSGPADCDVHMEPRERVRREP